MEKRLIPCW